jgi:hypothetical protein
MILDVHNVFHGFFDALNAFGFKRDDDHKVWDGYHKARTKTENGMKWGKRFVSVPTERLIISLEFCFVVRHVEKHNRNPKKPWSLRQVGFYHQMIPHSKKSIWILLQPTGKIYDKLKHSLGNALRAGERSPESSCLLYIDFLNSLATNWVDFIEYLWAEVTELVRITLPQKSTY